MGALTQSRRLPLPRPLLAEWRISVWVTAGVMADGFLVLRDERGAAQALHWTLAATTAAVYLLWEIRRNLSRNRRFGQEHLLPTLGAGTMLTLFRGLFTALLSGFMLLPPSEDALAWAPAALYLGVAVADFFDGFVARVRNHATELGAHLDIAFDAFGVLIAVGVLVHYGRLPWPFLLIGLLYYLFHGHMRLRERLGRPVVPLRPNPYRRMYAGFLFGYLAVALSPLFEPPWVTAAGYLFAAPVALGFAVDWLGATRAIDAESPRWQAFERRILRLLYETGPVGLRLLLLPLGSVWLFEGLSVGRGWTHLFALQGWPEPMLLATLLAVAGLVALGMAATGWLGRLAALILIALVCGDALLRGGAPKLDYGILGASIGILLLGSGRGGLWAPEDALLLRRTGARSEPARHGQATA